MKCWLNIFFITILLSSCAMRSEISYLRGQNDEINVSEINITEKIDNIEAGDILKIDVSTLVPEASAPFNNLDLVYNFQNIDMLKLYGYTVDQQGMITFPVLGKIKIGGFSESEIEKIITNLLTEKNFLTKPTVKVKRLNSKFTVHGEVKNPGTFSYTDKNLNFFQAIGYAGDLTIDGKRNNIKLIREKDGVKTISKIKLNDVDFINSSNYNIKNNDVIIVDQSFSKVKSAGFIGNPSSISSIASLLLSISLLITNR